jgi:hypothetical protein
MRTKAQIDRDAPFAEPQCNKEDCPKLLIEWVRKLYDGLVGELEKKLEPVVSFMRTTLYLIIIVSLNTLAIVTIIVMFALHIKLKT